MVKWLFIASLIFPVFVVYVTYFHPMFMYGSFNITIVSDNRPFDGVYFILPFDAEGPIYRELMKSILRSRSTVTSLKWSHIF